MLFMDVIVSNQNCILTRTLIPISVTFLTSSYYLNSPISRRIQYPTISMHLKLPGSRLLAAFKAPFGHINDMRDNQSNEYSRLLAK
jgi:hypothetical protein